MITFSIIAYSWSNEQNPLRLYTILCKTLQKHKYITIYRFLFVSQWPEYLFQLSFSSLTYFSYCFMTLCLCFDLVCSLTLAHLLFWAKAQFFTFSTEHTKGYDHITKTLTHFMQTLPPWLFNVGFNSSILLSHFQIHKHLPPSQEQLLFISYN